VTFEMYTMFAVISKSRNLSLLCNESLNTRNLNLYASWEMAHVFPIVITIGGILSVVKSAAFRSVKFEIQCPWRGLYSMRKK
jgi:hypothetical protein